MVCLSSPYSKAVVSQEHLLGLPTLPLCLPEAGEVYNPHSQLYNSSYSGCGHWVLGPGHMSPSGPLATGPFYLFQRIEQLQGDLRLLLLVLGDIHCSFPVFP